MSIMADITVPNASAVNKTYNPVYRSNGIGTWAEWSENSSGILLMRPTLGCRFTGDPQGKVRRFYGRYVHRYEDPNILGQPGDAFYANLVITAPLRNPVADLKNAYVLATNLFASQSFDEIFESQSGPT